MHIQVKLMDIFRDYLPPGSDASGFRLEVRETGRVRDVFSILNIPDDLPRVVLCNGQIIQKDRRLTDGDVIAIFSPIFGG
jgi:sulfur carrier protein ThiS